MDKRKRSYAMIMRSAPESRETTDFTLSPAVTNDDDEINKLSFPIMDPAASNGYNYDECSIGDNETILDENTGKFKTCFKILDSATGSFVTFASEVQTIETPNQADEPFEASDSDATYCDVVQDNCSSSEYDLLPAKKSMRSRKGMANPDTWKKNQSKIAREKGKAYITSNTYKGVNVGLKKRPKRILKSKCLSAYCKKSKTLKCWDIDDDTRKQMFQNFWAMKWDQRKLFVVALVHKVPVKQRTTTKKGSRRNFSLQYYLRVSGVKLRVCKNTFLNTFCLREATIHSWINNASDCTSGSKLNNRGIRAKKMSEAKLSHVNIFITRIPKMESHYCRQSSSKKYFEVNYQSMQQVYREYEKYFRDFNFPSMRKYFMTDLDCAICILLMYRLFSWYHTLKLVLYISNLNWHVINLQYITWLTIRHFAMYGMKAGEMTANIFASCLLDFIETHVADKSLPIIIYSDGCAAQNRNVVLSNALKYYCEKNEVTITQKYLTRGHTQMECDTVHSHIESQKKNRELHVPADFVKIIREASLSQKYDVKYVQWDFFKKYECIDYLKSIRPGKKPGDPCVNDLKAICYKPNSPIEYKLDFDEQWLTMPQRTKKLSMDFVIPPLYSGPLPITKRKFDDLQELKSVIVKDHHSFYDNLPHKD